MEENMPDLSAWTPRVLSILRIVSGLLFLEHGLMKLAHFPGPQPGAPAPLPPLMLSAGSIELVAGVLIALGLLTRAAAFIASGEMAIAYFMVHAKQSSWPALNGGDAAVLYCFVFFYLVFAGGGAWSLDCTLRRTD
jgi:putative oxidoreductase